jgi:hypothetical protein
MQENDSTVVLDPAPYGSRGPWAINIWARVDNTSGGVIQFIYSHDSSASATVDGHGTVEWDANQVKTRVQQGVTDSVTPEIR